LNQNKNAYLLYDADCGPCTFFMKIVRRSARKIVAVSLASQLSLDLVQGILSRQELFRSFHVVEVTPSNIQVYSAGDGLIHLLEYFPLGRKIAPIMGRMCLGNSASRIYLQATRLRSSCTSHKAIATVFQASLEASFEAVSPA